MIKYPDIDPVIIKIGPLALRWYGLMYVAGFVSSYLLVLYQLKKKKIKITRTQIDDLFFYLILGLIVGARLGYVLFYNLGFYLEHPAEALVLWHGGMSFHGGLIGAGIAGYIVIKRKRLDFFEIGDLIIPTVPSRSHVRKARQFHKWGTLRKTVTGALGNGISPGRRPAETPFAAL